MSQIRIKNFGPIKQGFTGPDGSEWMDIKKITVFIGNQGTGKSSVAKLRSTMAWLEKALTRGDFKEKDLTIYNRFKKHCEYQKIHTYFKDSTVIEYIGKAYSFRYVEGNISVEKNPNREYLFPKIMYVPAERNFVSAVDKPSLLKKLPLTLYTFLDEFEDAKQNLGKDLDLPINNAKFEYRKQSKVSWIVGEDYEVKLSEASSGLQSFVPLFLVTRHLAESINKEDDASVKSISIEEENRIKKEIATILSNRNLSEDVKQASLEYLSSRFRYSNFINIVEEPEQNLFPSSQRSTLYHLLIYANINSGNELLLTTHSPYIINYLTLSVKAGNVLQKAENTANHEDLKELIYQIVPKGATILSNDLVIYELDEKGGIIKLGDYKGLPSDENYLNESLAESNESFAELLKIEDSCH